MGKNRALELQIVEQRRRLVSGMRLRGMTVREIVVAMEEARQINPKTEKPWSLGTIQGDLTALEKQWRDESTANIADMKGKANARIEEVIRMAFKQTDLQALLAAIKQQREMFGLDAPKQTQLGGIPGGEPIAVKEANPLEGIDLTALSQEQLDALETAVRTLDALRTPGG